MLGIRNLLRFSKQPSPCTFGRTAMYFSSGSDDNSSKAPPPKEDIDTDSLETLLKASFQPSKIRKKNVLKKKAKNVESDSSRLAQQEKSIPVSSTKASTSKKVSQSLDDVLNVAHTHTKVGRAALGKHTTSADDPFQQAEPSIEDMVKAKLQSQAKIDLSIPKKTQKLSSKELLDRVKKIAKEVSLGAGANSNKVADELLKNLRLSKDDKPINLNDLTYEAGQSKGSSDHGFDLLRNRVVSEEYLYNKADAPWEQTRQRSHEGQERSAGRTIVNTRDLDLSLYPKTSLGIFTLENKENQRTESFLHTFHRLEQRDLWLGQNFAPRNWFEQCIQWTEQGKLWHFPINNEQGLEEEATTVSFTEHIFLEDHLEGWCPDFGPVRHFMELVCLGLSKNPYLNVQEKIDNILWYRDYFNKNKDILEASGTLRSGVNEVPHLETQ